MGDFKIPSSHKRRGGGPKQPRLTKKGKTSHTKPGAIRKPKKAPARFDDRIIRHLTDFFEKKPENKDEDSTSEYHELSYDPESPGEEQDQ